MADTSSKPLDAAEKLVIDYFKRENVLRNLYMLFIIY